MEMEECYYVVEWRIENLSRWRAEVHGESIESPTFYLRHCLNMELYPKGMSGTDEHLVVHFCHNEFTFSGDLSLHSNNGVLLCKQWVNATKGTAVADLPPGPKFEDVVSRIRGESDEDFITLRLRTEHSVHLEQHICTTLDVSKISLKINPRWIEELKPNETKLFFRIQLFPNDFHNRMKLETCSKNNTVSFLITPLTETETSFAVETCMNLMRSDGTVHSRIKKERVFCDRSPWTFLDSLEKSEFVEKGISLYLCLKITTSNIIQSPYYINYDSSNIITEPNNTLCFSEKEQSMHPVTSGKIGDSVTVLTKDLMCLYQDQNFSDLEFKCDNISFPVHKNILSVRSPVFKTMLTSHMKEASSGTVDVGDLDPSTLGLFLTYLYTGAVEDLQSDRALNLYYAADKYQVPSLKKECSKFLCSNVSISNVCDILSLADKHQDDDLTAASQSFILDNYNAVLKSKEWDNLKKNEPVLAVNTVTHFAVEDRVSRKHQ